jgi:hypothetical protein
MTTNNIISFKCQSTETSITTSFWKKIYDINFVAKNGVKGYVIYWHQNKYQLDKIKDFTAVFLSSKPFLCDNRHQ